jgi:hypothetical protein
MVKYVPYSRRQLNVRYRSWAKRNAKLISLLVLVVPGLMAIAYAPLYFLSQPGPTTWYVLGAIHCLLVVTTLWMLNVAFLVSDRAAIGHVRGAWGEENTSSELARAKRNKAIWGWVDSVSLASGDIDHLVVTRTGGLVAIDSKWRSQDKVLDPQDLVRAANRVRIRADGVVRTVLTRERGSHRAQVNAHRVTPLVVIWGAAQHSVPEGAQVGGIDFVGGGRLCAWLKQREDQPIDKDAAEDLLRLIKDFRASAWTVSQTS